MRGVAIFAITFSAAFSSAPRRFFPPQGPYRSARGTSSISVADDVLLRDTSRHKDLHVRVAFPAAGGPYPVIVFSHGAGASKDSYADLTRYRAERGYVTLQPTHADSLSRLQKFRVLRGAPLLKEAVNDPNAWQNRAQDITFVLDSLGEIERRAAALKDKMDARRIGVGGHSFGAFTAMLVGGVQVQMPNEFGLTSFADARPAAFLVLSGQGRGQSGLTDHSWDQMTRPMMVMYGSRDTGMEGRPVNWRRQPYDFSPPGDKYLAIIDGATHMTFTGRLAETRIEAEKPFQEIQALTLAFWDAYLKQDAGAKAALASGAFEKDPNAGVHMHHK